MKRTQDTLHGLPVTADPVEEYRDGKHFMDGAEVPPPFSREGIVALRAVDASNIHELSEEGWLIDWYVA